MVAQSRMVAVHQEDPLQGKIALEDKVTPTKAAMQRRVGQSRVGAVQMWRSEETLEELVVPYHVGSRSSKGNTSKSEIPRGRVEEGKCAV